MSGRIPVFFDWREMDINELMLHEKKRENCFRLLSACFYEPQKELFIEENLFGNLTESLETVCPEAALFSADMGKSVHNYGDEDLRVEYARLFVGPFELKAPPYGSVYIDGERRVMGDSTMEVIGMYQEEGLSKSNEFGDLPDHIAVELEFMSFMIYKEIEAMKKSDFKTALEFVGKQERFLSGFLGRWVKPFCDKIKDGTDNEFYSSLAGCLSVFIEKAHAGDEILEALKVKTV